MRRFRDPAISAFGLSALLYTLLRIPSFFEPHWYTDEAGYATTAREMLRGKLLYVDIWNNKPPLHLWTVAAILRLFGSSEGAFHFATYVFGLLTLAAVAYAAFHLLSRRRATLAVIAMAIVLGTPLLDAELLLPESLLIAPAAWAGALLLVRVGPKPDSGLRWPLLVGILAAAATAYQQTSMADAAAFLVILLLSPRATLGQALTFLGGFLLATAGWLVYEMLMAGPSTVAYALAGFYVSYTSAMLPPGWPGLLLLGGSLTLAAGLALAGAIFLRRQEQPWALGLWSVASLLAAAAPQHPYAHLLLPAMVPTILLIASLPLPIRILQVGRRLAPGAGAMACSVVIAGVLATGAGVDWVPPLASQGSNTNRTLTQFYVGLTSAAAGSGSLNDWRESFDYRVGPDEQVATWLKANGLSHAKTVVWSSDAWPYLLADLDEVMPTPPLYNNFALLGNGGEVGDFVRSQQPLLIVTSDADTAVYSEIVPILRDAYEDAFDAGPEHVWVLKGATAGDGAQRLDG